MRRHAAAIVTAIRATDDLDTGLARCQEVRATGASLYAALESAIQTDDGALDHTARQSAQQRRADFEAADTTAADTLSIASAVRRAFTDPRPAPNANPTLDEYISQRMEHEDDLDCTCQTFPFHTTPTPAV